MVEDLSRSRLTMVDVDVDEEAEAEAEAESLREGKEREKRLPNVLRCLIGEKEGERGDLLMVDLFAVVVGVVVVVLGW